MSFIKESTLFCISAWADPEGLNVSDPRMGHRLVLKLCYDKGNNNIPKTLPGVRHYRSDFHLSASSSINYRQVTWIGNEFLITVYLICISSVKVNRYFYYSFCISIKKSIVTSFIRILVLWNSQNKKPKGISRYNELLISYQGLLS